MTTSTIWKALLLAFMVIMLITWGLNQLRILSYIMSGIAIALLTAGLFFAAGAKFQQMDIENQAKQQKRDEHERIARLIENDEIEDTNHYEQNMESTPNHTRTKKPF